MEVLYVTKFMEVLYVKLYVERKAIRYNISEEGFKNEIGDDRSTLLTDSNHTQNSQKFKFSKRYLGMIQYHNYGEPISKPTVGDLISQKLIGERISKEIQAETRDTSDTIGEELSGNSENGDFDYGKKIHIEKPFSNCEEVDFAKFPATVANFKDANNQTANISQISCHKFQN